VYLLRRVSIISGKSLMLNAMDGGACVATATIYDGWCDADGITIRKNNILVVFLE
jgi:hypothetical protein